MKRFIKPEIEIVLFAVEDIITTSSDGSSEGSGELQTTSCTEWDP